MKKLLSTLEAIGITATSITSLIACNKPDNNENGSNKPEPKPKFEQPPENSNWKLNIRSSYYSPDNKWYIAIVKKKKLMIFLCIKFNFSSQSVWRVGAPCHIINGLWYTTYSFYRWNGNDNPKTPKINLNTGKILKWNEKTD